MPVIFENDGEADVRGFTIIGLSVKDDTKTSTAIGYFGRGFKDAVGILLRNHHKIIVQTGLHTYKFTSRPITFRGEEVELVYMLHDDGTEQELGFTTGVAKDWKMWMAYRELYSNCVDEAGRILHTNEVPVPTKGITRIIVFGQEFEQTHYDRKGFILESKPFIESAPCNVHRGQNRTVFYRGIRVADLEHSAAFTYDIQQKVSLTEDRTMKWTWEAKNFIMETIAASENEEFLKDLIALSDKWLETNEDFPSYVSPNDTLVNVVGTAVERRICRVPENFYKFYRRAISTKEGEPERAELSPIRQQILDEAIEFCIRHGYQVDKYPINIADSLGAGTYAAVIGEDIWVSLEAFDMGRRCVAHALIEEFIHHHYGHDDFTREFQEHLFGRLITMMEERDGRAL